ncbi:MAG: hypothetical protein K6G33_13135 [Ruminococcus sp.]|uniref:hypothetical protein n=1 Tax=Ruminococcus sp. TaxID=41978 RepID=UPI0025DE2188|nr:hypothetical protein [Ruminococcus sp.]MCR5601675.1 hypothetical protein [Ruminococcus sp.]
MKNSLFKRAVAAVATVPLAFTQCLTFANAVSNDAVQETAKVQSTGRDPLTLQQLLEIKPGESEAKWYDHVNTMLRLAGSKEKGGLIDLSKYKDEILSKAGKFKELAAYGLSLVNDVKYTITEDGDIIISGKVDEPNINLPIAYTPGEAIAKLAQGANVPGLTDIDFSSVKVGGEFKITLLTSALDHGSKFEVKGEYKTADGTYGLSELPAFAKAKTEEVRAIGLQSIEEKFPAEIVEEGKQKFNNEIDKYIRNIDKAINYEKRLLATTRSFHEDNVAGIIADANENLAAHKRTKKFQIPATATAISQKSIFVRVLENIVKSVGEQYISTSAAELGAFGDTLYNVDLKFGAGSAVLTGFFPDAEQAAVKAWVENEKKDTFISSEKKVTVKVNFKPAANSDSGDVDIRIERNLVTAPGTTTATTTKITTSVSTTAETTKKTTSSSTTAKTTSSSTESTKKTTSSTSTTAKTTSSSTESTKKTTSSSTTAKTTSSSTESTKKTTSSSTTAKTTSSSTESTKKTTSSSTSTTAKTTSSTTESTKKTTSSTSTTSTTSSTTSTTLPQATTSLVASYVTYDTETAFYLNIEDEFDKNQFSNVKLHKRYVEGYVLNGEKVNTREFEEVTDITADVNFGTATPSDTYKSNNASFKYDIALYANGEALKLENGKPATVTAYIALKGDVDLDNKVDAADASQVLAYYAKNSTNENGSVYDNKLSANKTLVTSPTDIYDEFAAFLGDVHTSADKPVTRYTKKDKRLVDANDASNILAFYAKRSVSDKETDKEIWDLVIKK